MNDAGFAATAFIHLMLIGWFWTACIHVRRDSIARTQLRQPWTDVHRKDNP